MTRITMLAFGTRGDEQPALALGRARPSAEKLGTAIRQAVTTPEICARAKSLGRGLEGEDGLGQAITLIDAHLAQGH